VTPARRGCQDRVPSLVSFAASTAQPLDQPCARARPSRPGAARARAQDHRRHRGRSGVRAGSARAAMRTARCGCAHGPVEAAQLGGAPRCRADPAGYRRALGRSAVVRGGGSSRSGRSVQLARCPRTAPPASPAGASAPRLDPRGAERAARSPCPPPRPSDSAAAARPRARSAPPAPDGSGSRCGSRAPPARPGPRDPPSPRRARGIPRRPS
jgi:hypothetical protein